MKTCPNCYKDLPDDAKFCTYCGKPLEGSQRQNEKRKHYVKMIEKIIGLF
ncbi:zinc-ribbon domain-containing protein [Allocoprobacillus halotolerans]|uniref:Zinc-ribbon domain-containing protein n=1 Tax=Allocoprobacillus halotolerans TaxID=2944914 RepID=A0ABY5I3J7_9FIRM|nr:zinc-ribbon domain-containing protein [Allocoprobacillus halotolerans]UTY39650.1 zinc-ribbon domain-containing protein [Allocoprobacillus halotolerans]